MSFGSAIRAASLGTAGTAFGAAAAGGNLHPAFVAAWVAGWLVSLVTPEGRFRGGWVLTAGLLAGPALLAAVFTAGLDPALAAVYFASLLLLARLISVSNAESHAQVHLLSILVMAGGAAVSPDITYLLIFVCYLFFVTFGLLLTHLRREVGEAMLPLPAREVVGRGLVGGTVALVGFALVFTTAVFLFVPRLTFGLGMARPASGAQVGLTDRIDLEGFSGLRENDQVVLRVWLEEGASTAELGERLGLYWRAQAMEHYDGLGWTSEHRPLAQDSSSKVDLWSDSRRSSPVTLDVEVVSSLGVPVIPVPDQADKVSVHERDSRGARIALRPTVAREVRTLGSPAVPYRFRVGLDPNRQVVDRSPPKPKHLELGEEHPAIVALADRLAEEAGRDPLRYANLLENWLSTRFDYSMESPSDPSLTHFLIERRAGHCEYFATAMAVMLRLQGVPSRVVVGFHGGRWNNSGGYYTVRQGDAHAWVEAWTEGVGWLRYEPTPEGGRGRGMEPPGVRERVADLWDSLQARWSRHVLGFDRTVQAAFGRRIATLAGDVARAFEGSRDASAGPRAAARWVLGIVLAVAVLLVLFRLHLTGGDAALELGPDARRARTVYRAFLKAARRVGIEKHRGDTPDDLLDSLARRKCAAPDTLEMAGKVVARYQASRFGGKPLSREEARFMLGQVRRIGERLQGAVPARRQDTEASCDERRRVG